MSGGAKEILIRRWLRQMDSSFLSFLLLLIKQRFFCQFPSELS
jgi:hypothetical protein